MTTPAPRTGTFGMARISQHWAETAMASAIAHIDSCWKDYPRAEWAKQQNAICWQTIARGYADELGVPMDGTMQDYIFIAAWQAAALATIRERLAR